MNLKCVKIDPNNNENDRILYKFYTNEFRKGYIEIEGNEKIVMPEYFEKIAEDIENFQVRDTDVFVASYPKSGTTWTQEMIWMIMNNLDKKQGQEPLSTRSAFLELIAMFDYSDIVKTNPNFKVPPFNNSINFTNNLPSPRLIKTHLHYSLLPKQIRENTTKAKIIYTSRNPKDVCISYYHHNKLMHDVTGDCEEFQKLFLNGRCSYGSCWENNLSYWAQRNHSNILFLTYEDMKNNLAAVVRQAANFLEVQLNENQVADLVKHLQFDNMKKNQSIDTINACKLKEQVIVNSGKEKQFLRKGIVGSYKSEMSADMIQKFDQYTEEVLKGTGFEFKC